MGYLRRLKRRMEHNEKYINFFFRMLWSSIIMVIGWGMLWIADFQYSKRSCQGNKVSAGISTFKNEDAKIENFNNDSIQIR